MSSSFRFGYANPSKVDVGENISPIPKKGGAHDDHGRAGENDSAGNIAGDHSRGIHSWDFVKVIRLPAQVTSPRLFCPINDEFLVLGDTMSGLVYAIDLATGRNVTKIDLDSHVTDCAYDARNDTLYVSEFPSGHICAYDREGVKRHRDIELPGPPSSSNAVAVDREGKIVTSSICGGTNAVYVIDPKTDTILIRGAVDAEEIKGEIDVLPSGMVVSKTGDGEFTIVDGRTGQQRMKLKRDDWNDARCAPDQDTETIYICYTTDFKSSNKPTVALVDEIDSKGGMLRRGVIQFKLLVRPVITPLVMPAGYIVLCNGKELLVYRKAFMPATQPRHK